MNCCSVRQNGRIAPSPGSNPDIIEIRTGRYLRIQHFNKRPRDGKFEKEMQVFMEYKRTGMLPNLATHISKQRIGREKVSPNKSATQGIGVQVPNSVNNETTTCLPNGEVNIERPLTEKSITSYRTLDTPSGVISRQSVNSAGEKSIMSSSNVTISMDQHGKKLELGNGGKTGNVTIQEEGELNLLQKNQSLASKAQQYMNNTDNTVGDSNLQSEGPNESNMVLFFFHGVGGSSDIWKSQIDYFTALGYEVVCPDMIGHGLSCAPDQKRAYHFEEILADISEIFDKYCKRKNVVIGHSYGCAFATVLARQRSSRIYRLVLVSGGGPSPLSPQPGVFTLPVCMLACIRPCLSCCFKRSAFKTNSDLPVPKEKTFDIPSYVLSYIMNGQYWPDGDDLYHSWIAVTTLLVYGRHDKFVSVEEEEEMNETIYGSKLEVLEHAGHMVMIETPDVFNEIVHKFIDDRLAKTTTSNQQLSNLEIDEDSASQFPEVNKSFQAERVPSRMSHLSLRSVKSAKSTKSMPRGLLSARS